MSLFILLLFLNKPLSAGIQLQFAETARTVKAPVSNRWGNLKKPIFYAIVTEGVCNIATSIIDVSAKFDDFQFLHAKTQTLVNLSAR